MKITLALASQHLSKDFLSFIRFPTFSISTSGLIVRVGSVATPVSIDFISDSTEEASMVHARGSAAVVQVGHIGGVAVAA